MLEIENVHKSFNHNGNTIYVLKGINLHLHAGESIAITGASGVGKSTLLNIMGTLEAPTQGSVRFESQDIAKLDETGLCRLRNRKVGFVFQFHNLLPEFNALENTIIPALIARYDKKESIGTARELLAKVGLENRLDHRAGELSGGEQQRVAIARALIMKPKLLLADEPTGNLDRITGEGVIDLLLQLKNEEDLSMVIATHNQRLAKRMSKQMEIVDGRIY
ncbi:MAG: ABC transporter ATP-binding protein [Deltaproteobacteria bacterium]|nr:ABC transporter ATP-binding protein [Deltaproteobacteria bacterium]